ncbi:hypothetical protein RhiJN_10469 [Ceratobasidium sp. AG-Ba]|nr:hypothetical protein RhiJN_10469 [Ceratobasidium sp. AG-Ba]
MVFGGSQGKPYLDGFKAREEPSHINLSQSSNKQSRLPCERHHIPDQVFDIGSALTVTIEGTDPSKFPKTSSKARVRDLTGGEARLGIQTGGEIPRGQDDIFEALMGVASIDFITVDPSEWVQTRVMRVVPVIDLLEPGLKSRVETLYSALLSYRPPHLDGIGEHGGSFDGTNNALRTITNIIVQCDGPIQSLTVWHLGVTHPAEPRGSGNLKHEFHLQRGWTELP